jgi:phosphatidylserine/phosphatidylglycerophosphate/cardiolipin synthase-like enzyme
MAAFLDGAQKSIEMAIYDLRLAAGPAAAILAAFDAAQKRGVTVRLMFNQDHPAAIIVPPPAQIDWEVIDKLKAIGVASKAVAGFLTSCTTSTSCATPAPCSAVLTGSTHWTNDSFHVRRTSSSPSPRPRWRPTEELGAVERPVVAESGHFTAPWLTLVDTTRLRPYFCPGRGLKLVHEMARSISSATRRIRICSPVITSGPILGALGEAVQHSKADISGVYDATQMDEVQRQWSTQDTASWKIAARAAVKAVRFGAKRSTPYSSGSVHDFMHAKILVADDYLYVGSFNLSHSGEQNAENVVQLESRPLSDVCAAYIDTVAARYGGRPAN